MCVSGIVLSGDQLSALEHRYLDELGFDYTLFLELVEPSPKPNPLVGALIITHLLVVYFVMNV